MALFTVAIAVPRVADAEPMLSSSGPTPTFAVPFPTYRVGNVANSVAVGDLNGDGRPDVAVANYGDNTVSFLRGAGDGTFAPRIDFDTSCSPISVAIVDLNSDGWPDLAVACGGPNCLPAVTELFGNGAGTFVRTDVLTAELPSPLTIGDLNGDGHVDFVTVITNQDKVRVRLGNGDGTFGAAADYSTDTVVPPFSNPVLAAIVDLNGDGHPDLVTENGTGGRNQSVFLGNGDGTFGTVTTTGVLRGGNPMGVTVGDLDGDDIPDLAYAYHYSVILRRNRGDGTLQSMGEYQTYPVDWVAIADMNADGLPDLVVGGDATTRVLLGTGAWGFHEGPSMFAGSHRGVIGDVNGDGKYDLVGLISSSDLSVVLGRGDGTFVVRNDFPTGGFPESLVIDDVNGDNVPDVVTASTLDNTVSVLPGNGDGTLGPRSDFPTGIDPRDVAIGDLNEDGHLDLVTANDPPNKVSVLIGVGDGTFPSRTDYPMGTEPSSVAIGDVNRDGHLDLITANWGSNTVSVRRGSGNGSFSIATSFAVGASPKAVATVDLNGDGVLDIIAANYWGTTISVLIGIGNGSFDPQLTVAVGTNPNALAIGDVNGDGKPDVAVTNLGDNTVSLFLGSFLSPYLGARTDFATGAGPSSVAIEDLNDDGNPELVVTNSNANTVTVRIGHGDGTFAERGDFWAGDSPAGLSIRDMDGDGQPDLVLANHDANTVAILKNTTGQVLGVGARVPALSSTRITNVLPNPGRGTQDFELSLPAASGRKTVSVFNVQGRLVWQRDVSSFAAGVHRVTWNGTDLTGKTVAPSVYFVRLVAGEHVSSRRFVRMGP
jgi:hypothetical protein